MSDCVPATPAMADSKETPPALTPKPRKYKKKALTPGSMLQVLAQSEILYEAGELSELSELSSENSDDEIPDAASPHNSDEEFKGFASATDSEGEIVSDGEEGMSKISETEKDVGDSEEGGDDDSHAVGGQSELISILGPQADISMPLVPYTPSPRKRLGYEYKKQVLEREIQKSREKCTRGDYF